jgi:hypothetical protein
LKILIHIAEAFGGLLGLAVTLIIWDYPVWKVAEIITDWKDRRDEKRNEPHGVG